MKCYKYKYQRPLTDRERSAVLRLYVQQRLPVVETAKRLHLDGFRVTRFLRKRGVLRPQGTGRRKFSVADLRKLESEFPTTIDAVLGRKYGVTKEAVRQIRKRLGYPSSQIIRHAQTLQARAERRKQKELARRRHRQGPGA